MIHTVPFPVHFRAVSSSPIRKAIVLSIAYVSIFKKRFYPIYTIIQRTDLILVVIVVRLFSPHRPFTITLKIVYLLINPLLNTARSNPFCLKDGEQTASSLFHSLCKSEDVIQDTLYEDDPNFYSTYSIDSPLSFE